MSANLDLHPPRSSLEMARRLFEELAPSELEAVTAKILRRHRRQLQRAQHLFDRIETTSPEVETSLTLPYRLAVVELRGQHELLATALDVLGHVPQGASPSNGRAAQQLRSRQFRTSGRWFERRRLIDLQLCGLTELCFRFACSSGILVRSPLAVMGCNPFFHTRDELRTDRTGRLSTQVAKPMFFCPQSENLCLFAPGEIFI